MLKRKDLAEEFSIIVQQEIKNHQDSLLNTNMAIDEFRRQMDEIAKKTEQKVAAFNSTLVSHEIAVSSLKDNVNHALSKCSRDINDTSQKTDQSLEAIRKMVENRDSYFLTIDGFQQFREKVDEWLAQIKASFSVQRDTFCQEIAQISRRCKEAIESSKQEITQQIAEEKKEIDALNQSLDHVAINFSGMQREIEIVKKQTFVVEKNIENLYTQFERLKGEAECRKQVS